jgi:hypothetical protein
MRLSERPGRPIALPCCTSWVAFVRGLPNGRSGLTGFLFFLEIVMSTPDQADLTALLGEVRAGRPEARARPVAAIYDELMCMASRLMRRERPDPTLQASALVNEALLRLLGGGALPEARDSQMHRHRHHAAEAGARRLRQARLTAPSSSARPGLWGDRAGNHGPRRCRCGRSGARGPSPHPTPRRRPVHSDRAIRSERGGGRRSDRRVLRWDGFSAAAGIPPGRSSRPTASVRRQAWQHWQTALRGLRPREPDLCWILAILVQTV